jgi:hypothetical protein
VAYKGLQNYVGLRTPYDELAFIVKDNPIDMMIYGCPLHDDLLPDCVNVLSAHIYTECKMLDTQIQIIVYRVHSVMY